LAFDFIPLELAIRKICIHLGPMTQVIADHRVNVGKRDRVKAFSNLFGGMALVIEAQDRVGRFPRAANAHRAVLVRVCKRTVV
jgi:hypothetical protein